MAIFNPWVWLVSLIMWVVIIGTVVLGVTTVKAHAGEWMGWQTYCQTHPHFAKHHTICKPYR